MKLFQSLTYYLEVNFLKFYIKSYSSILYIGKNKDCLSKDLEATCFESIKNCDLKNLENKIFDYIILSSDALENCDIQDLLKKINNFCDDKTTIFIRSKNNFSEKQILNFLYLSDFESITHGKDTLIQFYIPGISWLLNSIFINIPVINKLSSGKWFIARKITTQKNKELSVSIIIPCRNEKGNVEQAILRTPEMGSSMEFIFVEGHSKDDTLAEIKRVKEKYSSKDISYFIQDGKGKANAVFKGFDNAKGDVLIILDADLTVPPEDLIKFYDAISTNKARFINGSRLVYPMERGAMQFLNYLANHSFGFILSYIMGQKIKDSLCGTKVLYKKDYEIMKQNNFFFNLDPFGDFCLLLGASKLGLKIIDIPVFYKSRAYGSTQIRRFFHGAILAKIVLYAVLVFKFKVRFLNIRSGKEIIK